MLQNVTHATGGGVNHDWLEDETWKRENLPRVITGLGFCGSAAAFDSEFELRVNGIKMGRFRNLAAGAPTKDHILKTAIPIPANALIEMIVLIDTTTNAANIVVEFVP